ncbi:MAG TPA: 2-C-methyl-D-erythritol 4-phosphate cytidylyltransferase, partial [Solirubrobacterales bacterium]|nr:2-C-methyl-D-erythritol 4-phosphate cytidylyltransferase [Solirubrobacterales bacterium]
MAAASVTAVVAAAGSGERLGAGGPKAFVPLAGRPLVEWSIAALRAAAGVRSIVVACPPGHLDDLAGEDLRAVEGGATRARSVANALEAVETELVAIHDAARPLLAPELVEGTVATLLADPEADGAIAAAPVADTLKRAHPTGRVSSFDAHRVHKSPLVVQGTLDRSELWAAQTP